MHQGWKAGPWSRRTLLDMLCLLRFHFVVLCLALGASCHAQTDQVLSVLQEYLSAYYARDTQTMARMTYGRMRYALGGTSATAETLARFYAAVEQERQLPTRGHIVLIEWFQPTAGARVYFAEVAHEIDSFPGPLSKRALYVLVPAEAENRLEVMDLSCVSVDRIEEVAPGFAGSNIAISLAKRGLLASVPLNGLPAPAPSRRQNNSTSLSRAASASLPAATSAAWWQTWLRPFCLA